MEDDEAPAEPPRARVKYQVAKHQAPVELDDDADAMPPATQPKHHRKQVDEVLDGDDAKAPPAPQQSVHQSVSDDDASMADESTATSLVSHQKKHHPVEDMVNTAKGKLPSDTDSFDDDIGVKSSSPSKGVPQGFEGGWRSLLKKKQVKKKHKFQDQTNGIMDLVQTPTTYKAWKPDSTDAVLKASAKSELSAAERAFDAPDGGGFFLQLDSSADRAVSAESSGAAAVVQLLLEQYAGTLGSATLLQLSHSELNLAALKNLWRQIGSVNTSVAHSEHEAQSIQWCEDFQDQTKEMKRKKRATLRQVASELAKTQTQSLVYGQEVKAQERFLSAVDRDAQELQKLLDRITHEFDSTGAMIQKLKQDILHTAAVTDASQQAKFFGMQEALGKVEGSVSSSNAEITDIVKAAAARREKSGTMWRNSLAQVQEAMSDVEKQQARLTEEKEDQSASNEQEDGLRDRYQQMCKWTLDDFHAKQRQEECEKTAIQAALIVLSSS